MATQNANDTNANKSLPPPTRPKKPFPRPRPHFKSKEFPQPQKPSTVQTPLTNDPLWLDSFVREGDNGLTATGADQETPADAAGYVELVEQEYDAIASCDKYFAKTVPLSAFAYYHHIVWWYKIALMAAKHGKASHDQLQLIQLVEGYDTVIGAGAATYLSGLGDFTDVNGGKHRIVASEPNRDGHFGVLDHTTHGAYETKIAPLVSVHTVFADIRATLQRREQCDWWIDDIDVELPEQRRPPRQVPAPPAQQRPARVLRPRRREVSPLPEPMGVGTPPPPEEVDTPNARDEEDEEPQWRATQNLLGWRLGRPLTKTQSQHLLETLSTT
ncbi:unnamed protein product, partial [Brenthis ino]